MKRIITLAIFVIALFFNNALSAQVVIQRCDVKTGWQGDQTINVDASDKQEGKASIVTQAQAGTGTLFAKKFSSTQTGITPAGYLSFWLYVSDASVFEGGQVEITSSGAADLLESHWEISKNDLVNGWNEMQLPISAALETGGGANLNSINYFRIYQTLSGAATVKLDFVRFAEQLTPPVWPVLDVPVVDNSSLDGKVMFGYQGWFNHPDDGSGLGWVHWGDFYEPLQSTVDFYPDFREYGMDELYDAHITFPDGSMAPVYSSFNEKSVERHMKWVRDYNLDGVFLQRFISSSDSQSKMDNKDTSAVNVMRGCEKYGRVFAIMYDGIANKVDAMKADWIHLVDDIGVTSSDRYLHHRGLPLVSLWGYSVRDEATADQLLEMIDFFTNNPEPKYRASIKLGVAWNWYNQTAFEAAFKQVDVISPWFSGSTNYDQGQYWCDQNNVDYVPVVHPGFSWFNLHSHEAGAYSELNKDPREGGQYLWDEVNEVVPVNAKTVYIAMFDEIDEGTAMFKLAEDDSMLPREGEWVALDADGFDLPSDWYLRMASLATQVVRGNENLESTFGTPPEGIMTIRLTNELNGNGQGALEFIFPDFPGETSLEISIDGGSNYAYTTPDNAGTFEINGLSEGYYSVLVRHSSSSPSVDMGTVFIGNELLEMPGVASNPFPADGESEVRLSTTLGWTTGSNAVTNVIYFGTSATPDSIKYQFSNAFNPGDLEENTTYYWRVDASNGMGVAEGPVWSFTTGLAGGPTDIVVLDYCDEVEGWSSTNGLALDSDERKEGFASLTSTGSSTDKYKKVFPEPVNTYADTGSYFDLWVYVSDVSAFSAGGQIEISSSGGPDVDEYSWSVPDLGLVNGWNDLHLPIKSAGVIGEPDLSAINFFRFYQFVSSSITVKIDYLRFSELATLPLTVPSNLTGVGENGSVSLDWDDNTQESLAGYNVYRASLPGAAATKLNSAPVEESQYTDTGLSNGFYYYYTVTAVDTLGYESKPTAELAVKPISTEVPDAPTNLTVVPGDRSVTLDWDDNTETDLEGYNVYRSLESGTGFGKVNIGKVTSSTYTDNYLTNGRTYYYVVKALNDSQNESDASNEVMVTPRPTSVEAFKQEMNFRVYPNPAASLCSVKFTLKKETEVSVTMYDMSGRAMHTFIGGESWIAGPQTVMLPLNGFQAGSYILRVNIGDQILNEMLIVE